MAQATTPPRKADPTSHSTRLTTRVSIWLGALALIPLAAACWFATNEYKEVSQSQRDAEAVRAQVSNLIPVIELRALLVDEANWAIGVTGVESIGLDVSVAEELSGIALSDNLSNTRTNVDRLVDEAGLTETKQRLQEIRNVPEPDVETQRRDYDALEADLDQLTQARLQALTRSAGSIDGAEELIRDIRALEYAAQARQAVARQVSGYYTAQFSGLGANGDAMEGLVNQWFTYRAAVEGLRATANPSSYVLPALDAVEASPEHREFVDEVTRLVMPSFVNGAPDRQAFEALDANMQRTGRLFEAGATSAELHLEMVASAGADVGQSAERLVATAEEDSNRVIWSIALVLTISAFIVAAISRGIAAPLRRLSDGTRHLRAGKAMGEIKLSGPREVREATSALNDASQNLELVEQQARALAKGDHHSDVLKHPAHGAIGESLQEAVGKLTKSLAEREELSRRLTHEATHDGLTQLPNRNASLTRLKQSMARMARQDETTALLFVDLDGFKEVNDHYGHPAGDIVLTTISERLLGAVRSGDHVGRLGGDEFVVIAEPVTDENHAIQLAERLLDTVTEPIDVGDAHVAVSASFGIALANRDTHLSGDELLRDADLAVYQAKADGKGRICLCNDELRADFLDRSDLEQALKRAIAEDELTLHYQPIFDPGTQHLVTVEALVRWDRPGVGLVPPNDFVPQAERSELIVALDCWVIEAVAAQLEAWSSDPIMANVPVAMNVSGRHLGVDAFVDHVVGPLARRGVEPSRAIVEVTESALLDDINGAAGKLELLRRAGVRVAIDDFGTGYTSLAHLKTLPVDILKIDRSFTTGEQDRSLVKLIIDTGHLLGATITAEGIETVLQAAELEALGTDKLQGFLYGKPVPADELLASTWTVAVEAANPPDRAGSGAPLQEVAAATDGSNS